MRWIPLTEALPPVHDPVVILLVWLEDCYYEQRVAQLALRDGVFVWVEMDNARTRWPLDTPAPEHVFATHWHPIAPDPDVEEVELTYLTLEGWAEAGVKVTEVVPTRKVDDAEA